MSEHTPNTPPTDPNVPPPQVPPLPPRPRPTTGRYASPPYSPFTYDQQPPPPRPSGCGRLFVYGLVILIVIGMVGVGTLIGSFFLFAVATDAIADISSEIPISEKMIGGNRKADAKIAIITIDGMITSSEDGFVARQIRKAASDTNVKAVVLRVDSPGGTMAGSDYYLHLFKQMKSKRKIPVVVSMGSVAASGGYYVSMIGDEIYAEPSTITGSIGVIASLFNASELLGKIGVEATPITSGPLKAMGSFTKPMTEEERAILQHLIDDNFDRFKEIIREGRKAFANRPEDLDKLATGQIYTANDAVANKLIDKIGFIDDAVNQAGNLAGLTESRDYKVIQYKSKPTFVDVLLSSRTPNKLLSEKTLFEMTTPRIYLLCPHVIPIHETE